VDDDDDDDASRGAPGKGKQTVKVSALSSLLATKISHQISYFRLSGGGEQEEDEEEEWRDRIFGKERKRKSSSNSPRLARPTDNEEFAASSSYLPLRCVVCWSELSLGSERAAGMRIPKGNGGGLSSHLARSRKNPFSVHLTAN